MNTYIKTSLLSVAAVVTLSFAANAQTAINMPSKPSVQTRIQNGSSVMAAKGIVPAAVKKQAQQQRRGNYGEMVRPTSAGGQIQQAWDSAGKTSGTHSQIECESCVYRVRLREYMVTAIQLPEGATITSTDLGDGSKFEVEPRNANTVVVKPYGAGVDSSLQIYTEEGKVYSFYLRSEGISSKNLPDLMFKIEGVRRSDISYTQWSNQAGAALLNPAIPSGGTAEKVTKDFLKTAPFDPAKLRGWNDYKLWGDETLKPASVFRDDNFTYIQFGEKWNDLELPAAYVVVDEIDEMVNTRVSGTTYIIESTQRLITLKSGQSFMCIQYTGA
ncbi:TrbG/VirB9 family P-type conjugative transfer protein [Pseudovibrio sp. Tun.PSC04-5.I4]|uniref:TrbG/VirB9 family P-type conjugative transfer protein n=1 Tax=Pseudovibrio sp. Tun.PSC04-5.I4 TaxID=1798213 RepID=UPI000882B7B0|nr:TrbG/VirB9 family P-type conjugative transfer protein [Pseudovibrio sp. Tun.PSC04-5.I4]SDR49030.1 ComB9 competence protein [Pseudovibrio sp. Tun.PSC04-5.I4]